jgi:hypothetical protein
MSFSTADVDQVICAIEALIDDMDYRRHPAGTWTGYENQEDVRARLREALLGLIIKATSNEGLA